VFSDRFATFLAFFYSGSFVRIICINSIHNISKISRAIVDYQGEPTDAVFRYTRNRTPSCYACQRVGGESKTAFTIFQPKDGKPSGLDSRRTRSKPSASPDYRYRILGRPISIFLAGKVAPRFDGPPLIAFKRSIASAGPRKHLHGKERVEEKPRASRFGQAPVVTYSKLRAEQTGKVASGRSTWGS
jgi:hypothetical protein